MSRLGSPPTPMCGRECVVAAAAGINVRPRQTAPGPTGSRGKPTPQSRVKVPAKRDWSCHGKPFGELFARVNQIGADSGIALASQAFKDLVLIRRCFLTIHGEGEFRQYQPPVQHSALSLHL
jgi:hypothetical protein